MKECRLDFYELNDTIVTQELVGKQLLNFDGHAVHRGTFYDKTNHRIHFYALSKADAPIMKHLEVKDGYTHVFTKRRKNVQVSNV